MEQPIYQKIIEQLKQEIDQLPANTAIPSERELAEQYQASRMTVRKAIRKLVEEGYLYREDKKGTFVADQKLHKHSTVTNMMEELVSQENKQIIYFDVKTEVKDIAQVLEITEQDRFVRIVRVNKADSLTESIEEIYIVHKMLQVKDMPDIKEILASTGKIKTGSIKQEFIPMIVPVQYARFLGLQINTPIIMVESTIYTKEGRVYAFVRTYMNPRGKKLEINL